MSNSTRKWIRGAFEILIHGGAAALIVGFSTWTIDITWAQWRQIVLASFFGNGGLRFLQYFVNNPMPPLGDTAMTARDGTIIVGQQVVSINPLAKVQPLPAATELPKV